MFDRQFFLISFLLYLLFLPLSFFGFDGATYFPKPWRYIFTVLWPFLPILIWVVVVWMSSFG